MPTTTKYLWSNGNIIAEADENDTIHTVHTYEPQENGKLISTQIEGSTYYHHYDALGSTRALTNAAGAVTDRMTYDAWGNIVDRTGTTPVSFLWLGEVRYYYDAETGSFSVRERPYEPENGRWASRDPLLLDGINPYLYVTNLPVLFIDPSGLAVQCNQTCKQPLEDAEGTVLHAGPRGGALYGSFDAHSATKPDAIRSHLEAIFGFDAAAYLAKIKPLWYEEIDKNPANYDSCCCCCKSVA